jgi:hypothetical protein
VWLSSDTTWGVPAGALESNWWLEQFWTDYSLTPKLVHNLAQQCLSMDNYIPWQCWMMGRCLIIFGYDLRSSRGSYGEELIIGLSGTEYRLHSKIRSRKNCREKSASRKFVGRARKISCSFGVAHHGTFLMHFFLHEIFDLMLFAKLVSSLPEMIFPRRAEYRCDGKGKKR